MAEHLISDPIILCVLVQRQDGILIWVPKAEYEKNPESGSFVVNDQRTLRNRGV